MGCSISVSAHESRRSTSQANLSAKDLAEPVLDHERPAQTTTREQLGMRAGNQRARREVGGGMLDHQIVRTRRAQHTSVVRVQTIDCTAH